MSGFSQEKQKLNKLLRVLKQRYKNVIIISEKIFGGISSEIKELSHTDFCAA